MVTAAQRGLPQLDKRRCLYFPIWRIPFDFQKYIERHVTYVATAQSNLAGTTKVFDTSGLSAAELEKQVFAYAGELTGGAEISATSKFGVWSATLADGTTINVRSVSSSNAGRWTVDVKGNPVLQEIKPNYKENSYEIKFK